MSSFLYIDDLTVFSEDLTEEKATAMIEDAETMATLAAPCLATPGDLSELQTAGVRAVLRGAVLRWHEAGSGALSATTDAAGVFSHSQTLDTRQQRRGMFWPSEITQLQNICGERANEAAFSVDTVGGSGVHSEACSIYFNGPCSCGAVLSGSTPIFGGP